MPICRYYNIGRVDVSMYKPCIVHHHESRQDILYYAHRKTIYILLIVPKQLFYKRHKVALLVN